MSAKASWDVLRALAIVEKKTPAKQDLVTGVDASTPDEETRARELKKNTVHAATNQQLIDGEDYRFVLSVDRRFRPLDRYSRSFAGLQSGDYPRYGRKYWEIVWPDPNWEFLQSTIAESNMFCGLEHALHWENGKGTLVQSSSARIQGLDAHGHWGVAITQTRGLAAAIYVGNFFDNNTAAIVPQDAKLVPAIWSYCSNPQYSEDVRKFDEKLGVTNSTLARVPFDIDHWTEVAEGEYPNGLPLPHTDDPKQWIFHGHPVSVCVPFLAPRISRSVPKNSIFLTFSIVLS